ncbi:MAG: RND transporter, partial [Caulobacter sp.]
MSPTIKTRLAPLLSAISLSALAACTTVGPDFQAPEAPKTAGYLAKDEAAPAAAVTLDQTGVGPWWTALGSSELDAVIRQALADNPSLVEADATLAQARSALAAARGQAGP